jgi:hypothetical protein
VRKGEGEERVHVITVRDEFGAGYGCSVKVEIFKWLLVSISSIFFLCVLCDWYTEYPLGSCYSFC